MTPRANYRRLAHRLNNAEQERLTPRSAWGTVPEVPTKSRYPKCPLCERKHDPRITPNARELLAALQLHKRRVDQAIEDRNRRLTAARALRDHPSTSPHERAAAVAAIQRILNNS